MKLKTKTILLSGIMTVVIGVQAMAISMGSGSSGSAETNCYCTTVSGTHTIGVARSYGWASGDTYGASWVGCSGKSLYTTVSVGSVKQQASGIGWAQTDTIAGTGNVTVSETHKQK